MKKKALFVSDGCFPPVGGTSIILSNLLSAFSPDQVVLAGEQSYGTNLDNWDKPAYPIHYFEHPYKYNVKGSKYLKWLALKQVMNEIEELIKSYNISHLFGVFPNEFYLFAAAKVAAKLNLPFYSWFHNTYLDNKSGVERIIARLVQPYIFKESKVIFTMSEGMTNYMRKKYPKFDSRFDSLLHGFDFTMPETVPNLEINHPVRFLLTGNINHSNKDATERLCRSVIKSPNHLLEIYSGTPPSMFRGMGIKGDNVKIHSFIPLKDLESKFSSFDIMLLPHGFEGNLSRAEYKTIFPTRTIPLLYSGKPILAHMPKDTNIYYFLNKYECSELVTNKNESYLENSIERLIQDVGYRKKIVRNAINTSKMFHINNSSAQIKTILHDEDY